MSLGSAALVSTEGKPLGDVTVLDLSSRGRRYCGRLMAHLGATVVLPTGSSDDDRVSTLMASGEAVVPTRLDESTRAELLADVDVLITDAGPAALWSRGLHPSQLGGFPRLVHVSISPFGLTGPWADRPSTDLTLLAAGGLLALCGDADRPPVRPYGEQSAVAACVHAATATMIALLARDDDGVGQLVDVSVQEAVAHSIENAAQYYDCEGVVRQRRGAASAEAGSGLFECGDGYVYLLTSIGGVLLGWDRLVRWLVEDGVAGADRFEESQWSDPVFRMSEEAISTFVEIFGRYAKTRSKLDLYIRGQAEGVSIAPVSEPADLLANEQLSARSYFRAAHVDDGEILVPGSPFRIAVAAATGAEEAR